MPYEVWIRCNSTGEVRFAESCEGDFDEHQFRMWGRGTGNYGMDINRHNFFYESDEERREFWPQYYYGDYDAFLRQHNGKIILLDRRPPGRRSKHWKQFAFAPLDATNLPPFGSFGWTLPWFGGGFEE